MDEKYALSIGVRKSGVLPALDGAISDAHAFANWARDPKQKYNVTLITDEQWQPVTIDRLKTAIEDILENTVSRLLIFNSGHGICSQVGDYWLLSKYDTDADESVNVLQSMRSARRLGIGQIAIFSDACRSSLARAAFVTGRVIFPSASRSTTISPYDEFLSTDIGDPSNDPKSKRGSGANPRFPANEIGVPLKYFLVPTVFSQAPRKFFCKKMQRRCSEIVPLDQTNILDEGRLLPRRLQ